MLNALPSGVPREVRTERWAVPMTTSFSCCPFSPPLCTQLAAWNSKVLPVAWCLALNLCIDLGQGPWTLPAATLMRASRQCLTLQVAATTLWDCRGDKLQVSGHWLGLKSLCSIVHASRHIQSGSAECLACAPLLRPSDPSVT